MNEKIKSGEKKTVNPIINDFHCGKLKTFDPSASRKKKGLMKILFLFFIRLILI